MSTSSGRRFVASSRPEFEALEPRQLLSGVLHSAHASSHSSPHAAVQIATSKSAPLVLSGASIYAQSGQAFRAVIGTIHPDALTAAATLKGSINWGDGSAVSDATFIRQADGSIAVLGSHTYKAAGSDAITITVVAVPPSASLARLRLVGVIHGKAQVLVPDGGVTLSQTPGVPFKANVATFRSALSTAQMAATIDWGDGTQSQGQLVALPVANPLAGGTFAVVGVHTYAALGSYHVQITVVSPPPSPTDTATDGPTFLVAQVDSVIDVLPALPTVTAAD